jgi:hypothetical protein
VITLSFPQRIACAAATLFGRYGTVTRLAQEYGLCRQSVYRQSDAVRDDLEAQTYRQENLRLRQQLEQAQACCDDWQRRLNDAVVLDPDRQAEFAATAQAVGVSLPVARRLLYVVLRERTPSVAKLGRWTKAAAQRAAALLPVLDEHTRPRVRQAVPDEIFVRRQPILMVVEPDSLCWVSGRRVQRRDGVTWAEEFSQLPALEQVTKDGGSGLANGLRQANARRQQEGRTPAVEQDDHFHVLREGQRGLRISAGQANRAVDRAWKADKKERRRCRGRRAGKRTGHASVVALRWRQAEAAYQRWCRQEQAWQQVTSAFTLFDACGQLQTRAQAEATVAVALPVLTGQHWDKTRAALTRPGLWTYLDRAYQQLAALPVPAELRQAALRLEGARRRPEATAGEGAAAAALRGMVLVASVVLSLAGAEGTAAVAAVRALLAGVWRASSSVEGINSVLRMQQSRHRRLTQGLLDLKRLYWNCHEFRTGKRKGQSPYRRLGVPLPALSWWQILKLSPEELRPLLPPPMPPPPAGGQQPPAPAEPQQELSPQHVAA